MLPDAAQISRPDICFAVGSLSRYNANHGEMHWAAVKHVLRYLKETNDMRLTFRSDGNNEMTGYCDSDYAGDLDQRRSTSEYVLTSQGGAISWASKLQPSTALSTTEAEFISMVAAMQEALWLKRFECELFLAAPKTIVLFGDNQSAIAKAKNRNYHARTKHIDVRKWFIQDILHHDGAKDDMQRIIKL